MVTPLQQRIYDFIHQYIQEHSYSPALVEIARGIGISPKSVSLISRCIDALKAAGKLRSHSKGYRSTQVIDSNQFSLPLRASLGMGIMTTIHGNRAIDLAALLINDEHFLLEMKDNSMTSAGVFKDDFMICKQEKYA